MANIMLSYWYTLYTGQTPCEELLEKELCKLGVRYRTQHPFLAQKAFADFYLPDQKLVIEVDDPSHLKADKRKKDLQRTKRLEAQGLTVIRFTNQQVLDNLEDVILEITQRIGHPSS